MPIKNLTDRPPQFPRIGILRKGSPKQKGKNGREIYGKDLEGFRFDTEDAEALNAFTQAYGDEPRQVNMFLPYATTEENFQTWQEAWSASSLQHRCDGETCTAWLDKKTGKYRRDPIPCPGDCKPVGRLLVIIPELRRMAYVQVETHSVNDIIEIQQNLLALEQSRGTLRGIPMVLSRRPREISTPRDNGQRARVTKWLLHVEAAPRWVDLQLAAEERQALPQSTLRALPQPTVRALPAASFDPGTGEIFDDDEMPEQEEVPVQPAKQPATRQTLLNRINDLTAQADNLELEIVLSKPLDKMTYDELVEHGKNLRAAIDEYSNEGEQAEEAPDEEAITEEALPAAA